MSKRIDLALVIVIGYAPIFASNGVAAPFGDPKPTIELRLTKSEYVHLEPIEFELRVYNPGPGEIVVSFYYPHSSAVLEWSGMKFNATKAGLKPVIAEQADVVFGSTRGQVKPTQTYVSRIYLQRFVEQPAQGKFILPYEAQVDFYPVTGRTVKSETAVGKGTLSFTILPKDDRRLRAILEEYLKKADTARVYYEPMEALAVIDDPIVVPYLIRLGQTWPQEALAPMARFKHVKEARSAVVEALDSMQDNVVMDALRILADWKHDLGVDRIKKLIERDNDGITEVVATYAFALGQEKYLKLLPDEYRRANETTAVATLKLTKKHYIEGEPIEFEMAIANQGPGKIAFHLKYPALLQYTNGPCALSIDVTASKLRFASPSWLANLNWGLFESNPLKPRGVAARRCYLQRYLAQPPPGDYRLPYQLAVPLNGEPERFASGKGELAFTVLPREQRKLAESLERYLQKAKDPKTRLEATEALSVVSDPAVLPYLKRLRDAGLGWQALAGYARFNEDNSAQKVVLESLYSKDQAQVKRALQILAEWRVELNVPELEGLLARADATVSHATHEYLRRFKREDYKKLLPK